jgi:hypothetical protein
LVQGLKKDIDLNIKELVVFGDLEIIVKQVKNTIHCNSPHLRNYQQEVHRLIDNFLTFKIITIPRSKNILADSLDTIASRLSPLEDHEASRFAIELLYKPSIPDNITNWRVFKGEEQIISFLTNEENFRGFTNDDEVFQKILVEHENVGHNEDKGNNRIEPKLHTMPRGVVNLENLFDL